MVDFYSLKAYALLGVKIPLSHNGGELKSSRKVLYISRSEAIDLLRSLFSRESVMATLVLSVRLAPI
jgi:hypothetical protein